MPFPSVKLPFAVRSIKSAFSRPSPENTVHIAYGSPEHDALKKLGEQLTERLPRQMARSFSLVVTGSGCLILCALDANPLPALCFVAAVGFAGAALWSSIPPIRRYDQVERKLSEIFRQTPDHEVALRAMQRRRSLGRSAEEAQPLALVGEGTAPLLPQAHLPQETVVQPHAPAP